MWIWIYVFVLIYTRGQDWYTVLMWSFAGLLPPQLQASMFTCIFFCRISLQLCQAFHLPDRKQAWSFVGLIVCFVLAFLMPSSPERPTLIFFFFASMIVYAVDRLWLPILWCCLVMIFVVPITMFFIFSFGCLL